jgi:hypothetical protein
LLSRCRHHPHLIAGPQRLTGQQRGRKRHTHHRHVLSRNDYRSDAVPRYQPARRQVHRGPLTDHAGQLGSRNRAQRRIHPNPHRDQVVAADQLTTLDARAHRHYLLGGRNRGVGPHAEQRAEAHRGDGRYDKQRATTQLGRRRDHIPRRRRRPGCFRGLLRALGRGLALRLSRDRHRFVPQGFGSPTIAI